MKTTEKLLLKLFEGTDKFDYKVLNENWEQLDATIKEILENGDIVSPTVSIEEIENGYRLTITDVTGSKSFDLFNGEPGFKPVKGVDYFTDEDKAELVEAVLYAIPQYDGTVTVG